MPDDIMPTPPVVLVGDGQLELYSDLRTLEMDVELYDIQEYKIYDASGRLFKLVAARTPQRASIRSRRLRIWVRSAEPSRQRRISGRQESAR